MLLELIDLRIKYKIKKYQHNERDEAAKERIIRLRSLLRQQAEAEIIRKLAAIRTYISNPDNDPFTSIDMIYQQHEQKPVKPSHGLLDSLKGRLLRPN